MTEDPRPRALVAIDERLASAGFVPAGERGGGAVNHTVEYRSSDFAVRVSIDRGQWWAEGGLPDGAQWYDATIWASCLDGTPPGDPASVEDEIDFFITRHAAVAAAAREESTWACLQTNRERRARERLGMPPAEG